MEKNLMATKGKDEALIQSFAEIKKAALEKKPETKAAAKKAETKTAEKATLAKATAEKKEETKTTVKKTPAKKAETKTAEKAPAKKAAEKKPVAKKPVEKKQTVKDEVSTFVTLQINNQDYDPEKIQAQAIEAARKIKADVEKVDVYVNVAESAAYYTIDGAGSSDYRIDL